MKLRVGVVGLGSGWEACHRSALMALRDRFEVRAICAAVAARAALVAEEFAAEPVDGFRALAARNDIDAVLVLTSEWYGSLPILAACESGKAVYCAEAMDLDPSRAREIKCRVEESGVAFMAEFPRRYAPATLRLKELIATTLGAPRLLYCHERQRVNGGNGVAHRPHCPSEIRDLLELVDWCRYVVGKEPASVVGVNHGSNASAGHEYQMMSLEFSDARSAGALAQISYSRYLRAEWHEAVSFRPPAQLQVCCERGVAFVDLPATLIWFDEAGRHLESLERERPVGEQMLMQFHRAVTSLVRKVDDLEDTFRALTIVLAAQQSSAEGRRIGLPN